MKDEKQSPEVTKKAILKEDPTLPEYIPSDTRELIKKMLHKDPQNRPDIT